LTVNTLARSLPECLLPSGEKLAERNGTGAGDAKIVASSPRRSGLFLNRATGDLAAA
jgi:hypothetical protein